MATVIAEQVMRSLGTKRRTSKSIVFRIFKTLHSMPLRIKLEKPCRANTPNALKSKWYGVTIEDDYLKWTLVDRLKRQDYNCRAGNKGFLSKDYKTLFVMTYNTF